MTTQDALALEIAILDARIKADTAKLAESKAKLIEKVGTGGATIETTLAKITVTQQTEDRRTGTFSFALSTDTFITLDERVQANLIKQGVVSKVEKTISGQKPIVKVSAK